MQATTYLESPGGAIVPVRRGFSWSAFLVGPIWALVKRAYALAAILWLASGLLAALRSQVGGSDPLIVLLLVALAHLAVMLVCGVKGSDWAVRSLKAKGYVERA